MKKIIGILSAFLLPVTTFAQGYMMDYFNRGYECKDFVWGGPLLGAFLFLPIIGVILAICVFVFWLLMLVDAIKNSPEKNRLIWVVVIIFTHIIGALVYYFVEKRPKDKHSATRTEHQKGESK
jgi:hypothetical protein